MNYRYLGILFVLLVFGVIVYAAAIDVVNNLSPANYTWTNGTNDTVVFEFNYTGTGATAQCYLSVNNINVNESLLTLQNTNTTFKSNASLNEGSYFWLVNCTNVSAVYSVNYTINVDRTRPNLTRESPLNQTYNTTSFVLNYTVADRNLSSCWYVNVTSASIPMAGCANGTFNATANTKNTLTVYVNDSSGNLNLTEVNFTTDLIQPFVVSVSIANQTYNQSNLTLNYVVSDLRIDKCWIINTTGVVNSLTTCGNTTILPVAGFNTLVVLVNDTGSNLNASQVFFTMDLDPPMLNMSAPGNATYNSTIPLNYTVIGNVDKCWFYNNSATPTDLPGCANRTFNASWGMNYIRLYINDTAGNINWTEINFTYDRAPLVLVQSLNATVQNNTNVTLNFTVWDINTDKCWFINTTGQNNSLANCANATLLAAANSQNNITLFANDTGGNTTNATVYFTVDTSVPTITVSIPFNGTLNRTNITLSYVISDNTRIDKCWFANITGGLEDLVNCNNLTFLAALGQNNITVITNDSAGNRVNSSMILFTVDVAGLNVSMQTPGNGTYNASNVTLNYTVWVNNTNGSTIDKCWLVNASGSTNSLASCVNVTILLLPYRMNTISLYVNNTAGSMNWTTVNMTYDAPPSLTLNWPTNRTYNNASNITLNYTVLDVNLDKCWYINVTGSNISLASCANATINVSVGLNNITLFANDTLGNTTNASVYFTVDTSVPSLTVSLPTNTTYSSSNITITFVVSDTRVDKCWVTNVTGANNTLTNCENSSVLANSGLNNITIYVNDTAGNMNSSQIYFTYTASSSTTTTTTSVSSSGGGGTYTPSIPTQTTNTASLSAGVESSVVIDSRLGVSEVKLEITEAATVQVIVKRYDSKPAEVTTPPSSVYKYIEITSNVNKDRLTAAKIGFNVTKAWLTSNSVSADQVKLMRYNLTWQTLETKKVAESSDEVKYEAVTPGFSVFAISVVPAAVTTTTTILTTAETTALTTIAPTTIPTTTISNTVEELTTVSAEPPAASLTNSVLLLGGLLLALLVVGAYFYFFYGKKTVPPAHPQTRRKRS